jgi:hypothetical protein
MFSEHLWLRLVAQEFYVLDKEILMMMMMMVIIRNCWCIIGRTGCRRKESEWFWRRSTEVSSSIVLDIIH